MWGVKTETIAVIVGATLGAMTTFIKRKFKEDSEEFKRRNHPGNRTMWDGPHSSKTVAPLPIFEYLFLRDRVETWNKCLKTPTHKNLIAFKNEIIIITIIVFFPVWISLFKKNNGKSIHSASLKGEGK